MLCPLRPDAGVRELDLSHRLTDEAGDVYDIKELHWRHQCQRCDVWHNERPQSVCSHAFVFTYQLQGKFLRDSGLILP